MKTSFTSLMFERGRGWSGLLVEPHPLIFAKVTTQAASRKKILVDFLTLIFLQEEDSCKKLCRGCKFKEKLGAWQHAWPLAQSIFPSGANNNSSYPTKSRPHLAKFASEASPGAMAGLVPQDSPVNAIIANGFP